MKFSFVPKNERKYFSTFALASKKTPNQKIRALYADNRRTLFWLFYTIFLIWPLLEQKSRNIFVHFLVKMKTLKSPFEIKWPLIGGSLINTMYWWPLGYIPKLCSNLLLTHFSRIFQKKPLKIWKIRCRVSTYFNVAK